MKKVVSALFLSFLFLSVGTIVFAADCPPGQICNPLGYENFEDLVNAIINFLWIIGTPLAAIMFVISGIMFVTSVGNPEKVKTAKNIALYTAIGYAIIIMASGLIKVLQSLFQGS